LFIRSNIPAESVQYAILGTGVINFLATIFCISLIDRLGRRPLLIFPIAVIIVDFAALIFFLEMKDTNVIYPYLSIACILLFIVCFAVGLGPIPFLYTAEVFPQNARSTAMAVTTLVNWLSGLLLTILFPLLSALINQYVFLVFGAVMVFTWFVLFFKVWFLFVNKYFFKYFNNF
jgi:SP family facilitated glucose transporter-like MFS transporter 1